MPKVSTDAITDWHCTTFGNESEIDVRINGGDWETLATVKSVAGLDAEAVACYLIRAAQFYKDAG